MAKGSGYMSPGASGRRVGRIAAREIAQQGWSFNAASSFTAADIERSVKASLRLSPNQSRRTLFNQQYGTFALTRGVLIGQGSHSMSPAEIRRAIRNAMR